MELAIKVLLKTLNISRDPLVSIQKSAVKGMAGIIKYLDSTKYKLSGDIAFIGYLPYPGRKF